MPRKSPYSIELTTEERTLLERQARCYTLSYREVVRAKIVLRLPGSPWSPIDLASELTPKILG